MNDKQSARELELPELREASEGTEGAATAALDMSLVEDYEVPVVVVLGRARKKIRDLQTLDKNRVITLDKLSSEPPAEIYVGDKLIGRGSVIIDDDEHFAVELTEVSGRRLASEEPR
jgi:flagellar motor switch protein FliN